MDVIESIQTLRDRRDAARRAGRRVAFVPTMGALHAGHLALMDLAAEQGDEAWASVFVNPAQFGPGEDLERYPRTLDADLAACEARGVAVVFVPSVETIYPPRVPDVTVNVPSLATILEGEHRPGFFAGVCRVVAKLFNLVQPDAAVFGEKDYQQLIVIAAMTAGLDWPIRIVPGPTVREADGLAMSSRNRYLDADQRRRAVGLFKALTEARAMIVEDGEVSPETVEAAMRDTLQAHRFDIDYAVIRHPHTLEPMDLIPAPDSDHPAPRGLIAARIGEDDHAVRLIDNLALA